MDSPSSSRHYGFSAKSSSVDVSQLDKVNAIPNKAADNVLLSNLCPEDQNYLKFLMEDDSSNSEDESQPVRHNSPGAWSPMVQSPMMNKRKGPKSSYAITLSLEDISYIRPSWGISKGIRTIEVDGKKAKSKKLEQSDSIKDTSKGSDQLAANKNEIAYTYFLLTLTIVVVFLTLPPYLAEQQKNDEQVRQNKLKMSPKSRTMEIYRPDAQLNQPLGEPILRVDFGLGIPTNLKPEECNCVVYATELRKRSNLSSANDDGDYGNCLCLDWPVRANMRVMVEHKGETDICYGIKWQSYDSLDTPLIDCFTVEKNDQWFGLGDIHSAEWALNELDSNWIPLATNLTTESALNQSPSISLATTPSLGSYANLTLFSTGAIFIGNLRSDFRLFVKVEQAIGGGKSRICIRASCSEKCGRLWNRMDDLIEFRHSNNVLEYQICSSADAKALISNHISQKVQLLDALVRGQTQDLANVEQLSNQIPLIDHENRSIGLKPHFERLLERESHSTNLQQQQQQFTNQTVSQSAKLNSTSTSNLLPEGIGMIERTIFATSPEFMPTLDGKTLRQYVDSVVKMGLKTSLILLIDSRWETYIGSLQVSTTLFPKWRLLFDIIHNKGFKVILTWKPFVDTLIGSASVNQLFEAGKLYGISQGLQRPEQESVRKETILRRKGRPYVFKCKESQVGYCVLLDLEKNQTRTWLIEQIGKSELLASNVADGILLAGSHPDGFSWDAHYRRGLGRLVHSLYFKERIFTLPQWTGNLGYIQLASRPFSWPGLRSVLNSVLNLGFEGFSLIHPGSVWGDLKFHSSSSSSHNVSSTGTAAAASGSLTTATAAGRAQAMKESLNKLENFEASERSSEELCIRWLQVSVFLPILQFNNLAPIERYGLQDLLQNLVKIRKLHLIGELKKNLPFTPLISQPTKSNSTLSTGTMMMALIRPVWFNQQHLAAEMPDTIVADQFCIGPDILVAPILSEATRQRDIYLPNGFWHDELRGINIRGGKWLRNYPVELAEIAWFTRVKR